MKRIIQIKDLSEIPEKLKVEYYFDFKLHGFEHIGLFERANNIVSAVYEIGKYAKDWLKKTIDENILQKKASKISTYKGKFEIYCEDNVIFNPANIICKSITSTNRLYVEKGAIIIGANIYLDEGDIYIGADTVVEPSTGIIGPTIIGKNNSIRQGAYFRGKVITGNDCIFRGELKNVVMMDKANFPHPSYVGDSICGYHTHFGNQATTANMGIFAGAVSKENRKNIVLKMDDKLVDIGKYKLGIIMGDFSQIGCNSVSDPATFLAPYTIVYALTSIPKGFYGPRHILKNKAMEKGIIEIATLKE